MQQRTPKQIAASRLNGTRSRGPATEAGKRQSSQNGKRHGLLARAILMEGESRGRFNALVQLLNDALQPESAIEHLLVGKMAASHWRQLRIWNLEREGERNLNDHEMKLDRQFFRALDRVLKLRAHTTGPAAPTT
jgi:hypothetical protein